MHNSLFRQNSDRNMQQTKLQDEMIYLLHLLFFVCLGGISFMCHKGHKNLVLSLNTMSPSSCKNQVLLSDNQG
uniref:Uncharacterized protein n=1 Tax=Rhizophora mucronata TaxID=61149 RepID=A0A2P2Q678_RHIMU